MADKVYDVIAQVLGIPIENLTDEDSPDTIESWDSLIHINLVLALEAEFAVSLSPDDVAEMLSVGVIITMDIKECNQIQCSQRLKPCSISAKSLCSLVSGVIGKSSLNMGLSPI